MIMKLLNGHKSIIVQTSLKLLDKYYIVKSNMIFRIQFKLSAGVNEIINLLYAKMKELFLRKVYIKNKIHTKESFQKDKQFLKLLNRKENIRKMQVIGITDKIIND